MEIYLSRLGHLETSIDTSSGNSSSDGPVCLIYTVLISKKPKRPFCALTRQVFDSTRHMFLLHITYYEANDICVSDKRSLKLDQQEVTKTRPTRWKCGSSIKAGFVYCSPISIQMNVSLYKANPTKPNNLGTSWNGQFIERFGWVRFLFLLNMYMSGPKQKFLFLSIWVCWVFGLPMLHYVTF